MSAASSGPTPSRHFMSCSFRSTRRNPRAYARPPSASMRELSDAGIEVLYDDRDARPGVKFADAELLGHSASYRGRRARPRGRHARIPASPRHRERGFAARRCARLHPLAPALAQTPRSRCCLASGCCSAAAPAPRRPAARSRAEGRRRSAPSARPNASPTSYDSAVWYKLMEPRLRSSCTSEARADGDAEARLLRDAPHRARRACRRAWSWRVMDRSRAASTAGRCPRRARSGSCR